MQGFKMKPKTPPRPQFSAEEVQAIALDLWKIKAAATELPSERDQNFHLRSEEGLEYVFKIANSWEKRDILDLQVQAIHHLARFVAGYALPAILKTGSGEEIAVVEHRSGGRHYVRLLSFLPGKFLSQVRPHSPVLLRSLGVFLGALSRGFASFNHPAADRELKWNMKFAASTIRDSIPDIASPEGRGLAHCFLERFEARLFPLFARLRTSIIHNDSNDNNVLVGRASPDPEDLDLAVTGLIDFGDMVAGFPALELAVGMAYAMLDKNDPLAAAGPIVAGYHEVFPLTELEIGCLYDLVAARLCLSVVISAEQRKAEPANEYLSIREGPAWALLAKWRTIPPDFAHAVFRDACGLTPDPRAAGVADWLVRHRNEIGPLIDIDFKENPPLVFDLSVESPRLGSWTDGRDMQELSALLFGRMAAAKARVGIGRYDEARRIYTEDAYRSEANDGFEWRTIHLGIDLFLEPGTTVLAPLEGAVHSFADNARALDYGPTIILEHEAEGGLRFYTLYGHLTRDSLEGLARGRKFKKGETIGRVGQRGENGGWPPHLHFQVISNLLGKSGDYAGVAPPSQRRVWLSLCPDPNLLLGIPESLLRPAIQQRDRDQLLELRSRVLGPNLSLSYRRPLKIVRGFRQFLYDEFGQSYLDATNNVPHVGHCHPRVVRAAQEQISVLNTNTRYLHDNILEYALRLKEKLPDPLSVFFFVSSGSEANDLALRLARTHTRRRDTIVIEGAYHGNLTSLIEISPYKFDGPGGEGPPAHVRKVPSPDGYRGPIKRSDPDAGAKYAQYVETAVELIRKGGRLPAVFICEPLQSSAGIIEFPPGYLAEAFRHVRKAGAVCIVDEVQVGFGRLGTHFWGFETHGVIPDIVTMGKPIGNGHPLAAVATTPEIAASFKTGMEYFSTFGGNPVSCAVGLAVLDIIEEEKLQLNAQEVGRILKAGLERLKERHRLIGDVRGSGLFLGAELVRDRHTLEPAAAEAAYVVERLKEKGILISTEGPRHNILKIRPPLVINRTDAARLLRELDGILGETPLVEYG
jgi:4-aminobutyrate aminotransferase-like enzyme/Ser/Thr protein kinase RdoA (MazF antagonist)